MGGAGFEPAKVKTNRFTVCPRWPLEYPPIEKLCDLRNYKKNTTSQKFFQFLNKSRWRDSNPRPADYKSAALAS